MNVYGLLFISIGLLFGLFLMAKPRLHISIIYWLVFIIVGPIVYFFPAVGMIRWAVLMLSIALFLRVGIELLLGKRRRNRSYPTFFWAMLFFLVLAVLTSIANGHFKFAAIDAKNYIQFWCIPLAFLLVIDDKKYVNKLLLGFLVIAVLLEVPLGAVQYLLKGPRFPGDAVTGTFGGTVVTGTGPNAALSIFLVLQIGLVFFLCLAKRMKWIYGLGLSLFLLIPIGLANAKGSMLFIVLLGLFIMFKEFKRHPTLSLVSVLLIGVALVGVFSVQMSEINKYGQRDTKTAEEFVDKSIEYNVKESSQYLTRYSAITYWYSEHTSRYGIPSFLFGHGLGSSRSSGGVVEGYLLSAPRYRGLNLGLTSLSRLLWDVGLVGTLVYISIFVFAYFDIGKTMRKIERASVERCLLLVCQLVCFFAVAELAYKDSHFAVQTYNAYVYFTLGAIAFYKNRYKFAQA